MAPFISVSFSEVVLLATAGLIAYITFYIVYNLYFHPLASFPGPLIYRASIYPYIYNILRGVLTIDVLAITEKYGPVVRIAPNELIFTTAEAWKDIYSHRNGAVVQGSEFSKYKLFYRTRGLPPSIISENRENHALLRRSVAHGFSDKSLREQEPIIGGYVDLLIKRLKERCVGGSATPISEPASAGTTDMSPNPEPGIFDMRTWYTWTTFDVIGDLAFGEPFDCLEGVHADAWVTAIGKGLRNGRFMTVIKNLGLDVIAMSLLRKLSPSRRQHEEKTTQKLRRRMALNIERPDFIEGLLRKKDDLNLDFPSLRMNAGLLIIAGSETSATLLSGVTFLLLSNPHTLAKLTEEVRSSFNSDDDITLSSVGNLHYMLACLNEALRLYPPVPGPLPRVVPKGGAHVAGRFVPQDTVVAVWQWPMNHSARNFSDPFAYKPERFLEPEKFPGDRLDAVKPFSDGPRNCIGKNLAIAEMRLVLARIIFNFDMKLVDPDLDWLKQDVHFLWDKGPLPVQLTPVTRPPN